MSIQPFASKNQTGLVPQSLLAYSPNGLSALEINSTSITIAGNLNTPTPIYVGISATTGLTTTLATGLDVNCDFNMNSNDITNLDTLSSTTGNPLTISSDDILYLNSGADITLNALSGGVISLNSGDNTQITCGENFFVSTNTTTGTVQFNSPTPTYFNTATANTGDGTIIASNFSGTATNSTNSVITTATSNINYTLLVATANTGTLPILGSGSDLNYNPVSQTLIVKNMTVSGNETQTGTITTNILRTDIMIQQVSYLTLQFNTLANFTALLTLGTFIMSTYDNGSTVSNSIVTINLPALPNDGSYDGYTFQIRKLRGGVNQSTNNWLITAPTNIIISSGNSLNAGSGGANSSSTPVSFTQRYIIATYSGVGYYVGCSN
jgi:hypothetical protein